MFSAASALLALAASASAHMVITQPTPFGKSTLNSSPLGPGDFPCKQRPGVYEVTEMNQWNAGETHTIQFMGSAVHGGGSCQFSITTDPEPSKDSQWKVIQSVIGGCPSNVTGNLPSGSPTDMGAATFPVTMPKDIPDGRYTFAWTWLNKVGNREFYMNCAPIQVGSGSGTASTASAAKALSVLPDMFVANIPEAGCTTAEEQDFVYPDPGQSVIKGNKASPGNTLSATCKPIGAGAGKIGSPSSGNSPSSPGGGVFAPGASSAPASSPAAQPSPPAAQPNPPASQPSVPAAQPSAPMANPVPTQPETPSNPPPKSPENNNNSNTPTSGGCTPCTTDGAVVCIGSKQFGLCNRGCAVAQDLAAGMVCKNGAIIGAAKRHVHFPRAHLHRRLSAARLL